MSWLDWLASVFAPKPVKPIRTRVGKYPGVAPTGDLPGWRFIFADNFDKAAPVGSFANDTPWAQAVYEGAEGQHWYTYSSQALDTYDKRPYRPGDVLSVEGGCLVYDLHQVNGMPAGANLSPCIKGWDNYQTYGRYSARMKVENAAELSEYYIAWLLWPKSENWPDDGEIDFPEGRLAGTVGGANHWCMPYDGKPNWDALSTNVRFDEWHVYTIEWSPNLVRFLIDDNEVFRSTKLVASTPMRWQLQVETKGHGDHRGRMLVGWVAVWEYVA